MKKKIIVTGAAGFIGAHAAKCLIDQEHDVIGIDNLNDYYNPKLKTDRLKNILGKDFYNANIDIANYDDLQKICINHKPECILHLAAQAGVRYSQEKPNLYLRSNIQGFLNILEIAKNQKIEHLIYASSSSVYGGNTKIPYKETDRTDHPLNLYAATKKSNELMAAAYNHMYGIKMTGLRFFTVYGPWGRPDMAITKFVDSLINELSIDLYNNGLHRRDFTYIDDIVTCISKLIESRKVPINNGREVNNSLTKTHKIYNIGSQDPILMIDIVKKLEKITGKKAIINKKQRQDVDALDTYSDSSEVKNDLALPSFTTIEEGLENYFNWHKSYYS